jgi:hypothetical protein
VKLSKTGPNVNFAGPNARYREHLQRSRISQVKYVSLHIDIVSVVPEAKDLSQANTTVSFIAKEFVSLFRGYRIVTCVSAKALGVATG